MKAAQPAISLQQSLIQKAMHSSILAGLLAWLLMVAISLYQAMQTHDQIMDEIADMLMISDLNSISAQQLEELSDEFDVHYQLYGQQQLLAQSEDYPTFLPTTIPQQLAQHDDDEVFSFLIADGQLWRRYQATQSEQALAVTLYQPLSSRFQEMLHSMLLFALILLVLWGILWLLLRRSIAQQLAPFKQLSQAIADKSSHDLSPIIAPQPALIELQPIVQQLNYLLQGLDRALQAEQRFTADASHELRSPLSALSMRLQLLSRKYADENPNLLEDLERMQQDLTRSTQILEQLLLLARLDPTDLQDLPQQLINLPELLEDALALLQPQIQQRQSQLHVVLAPLFIQGNPELIFTCLRNILDNAIRYMPQQGDLYVSAEQTHQAIQIYIENSGEINAEVLTHLGERFYRALGSKTQGSGLGLSICHQIMAIHHGQLYYAISSYGGLKVCLRFNRVAR
ncbi:sensor histidine kinase [Acinetobacter larvae]|uniref:histidine kinase n=1 Tax=Acinetobacter larvae TaxID=1789224 RepID=A0A1B2LY29_9GAMM|nr:ATP-binding protein [Acinetobacter larvae]AOA57858.1 hypothetical protein BFG52_05485 [Acinetobacter larvae]